MKNKKFIISIIIGMLMVLGLSGCGLGNNKEAKGFDVSKEITVVSREDGSGTRGAFIELLEIEEKDSKGNKKDLTTDEAVIANKTDIMLTNIAGDNYAVGYVSLGSINESVKAVSIDGVQATAENIKNGSYTIARPFNIVTKGVPTEPAQDFINYILSAEGQAIVADGYIAVKENRENYKSSKPEGKLVIAGSSSVSPVMEKLVERYKQINPDVDIEIQTNDSTTGINGTIEGTCDIGMASRNLKDSELEMLNPIVIAMDGIAIIVNDNNPIENFTRSQVKSIFTGEITTWEELK
ncbi:MAG: substrate-binding domain-containing protein [Anaerovoracaceae bacterium]|jgi:phosphate transport system substrate-binding protein